MDNLNPERWIFLFILGMSMLLVTQVAKAADFARLTKISGIVKVIQEGARQAVPAALAMPLEVGDQIVTHGEMSGADITFPNQDVVRIMPDSTLKIKESDFKKEGFRISLKLLSGKIFNVVRKFRRGSLYEVETRYATAGVRGTVWSAEVNGSTEKGDDVFMVKEGTVAAASRTALKEETRASKAAPAKEIMVSALKKTVVKAGKAPTEPVPLTPEEIAMFDILDDLIQQQVKDDIRNEIRDEITEDILEGMTQ